MAALVVVSVPTSVRGNDAQLLAGARRLLLRGRYDEALAQYNEARARLASDESAPADRDLAIQSAVGHARCRAARGEIDEALADLAAAAERWPDAADLLAEMARLNLERGRVARAEEQAERALGAEPKQLWARWVQAELLRTSGRLDEADAAYKWFVDYYNTNQVESAEDLWLVARAAAQYARWNRLSRQFSLITSEVLPAALRAEPDFWPAQLEIGLLFAEKYNEAEAAEAFAAASEINPHAPDTLAARARLASRSFEFAEAERLLRRALRINPQHLKSHLALADLHFATFAADKALETLEAARKVNPIDERTLGRLATAYRLTDGLNEQPDSRAEALARDVAARNPSPGEFYEAMATSFDQSRNFPIAAEQFAAAIEAMPQLVGPRGQLGLMQMRLGEEQEARETLTQAFEIDPFNVRVRNSLEVLDVLSGYVTHETEHLRIRYDRQHDEILARCAAHYLERIYPELSARVGYQLPEPALLEIFNRARNTDAQGWFSARMVGLPNLHIVAACAGRVVAMASPTDSRQRFNWARTLRHEMIHLFNLEQTAFQVPHWFTEAVAVWMEDQPRRPEWDELLVRRVPRGEVYHLDTINTAFINPGSAENWQMAYCQAELYAEYLVERFGADALQQMLTAYRETSSTRQALNDCFGIEQQDFERGYSEYLRRLVEQLSDEGVRPKTSFAELARAHELNPDDHRAAAELALACVTRGQYERARSLAAMVQAADPQHPLAACAQARLLEQAGEREAAAELLRSVSNPADPHPEVWRQRASLALAAEDYAAVRELCELGDRRWPRETYWARSLAIVAIQEGDTERLIPLLEQLAEADEDDLSLRQKLARLAAAREDHEAAARWAREAVHLQVLDAAMHRLLARSLLQLEDTEAARFHESIATELESSD